MALDMHTFIVSTGNPRSASRNGNNIPLIRAHAMRAVRRQKRLASGLGPHRAYNDTRVNEPPLPEVELPSSDHVNCDRTLAGPFCGTAIDLPSFKADVSQRLDDFLRSFTPGTFPTTHVRHECGIFRMAVTTGNPALVHALCAVGAAFRALSRHMSSFRDIEVVILNDELDTSFRTHKQYAIRSLRTFLSDQAITTDLTTIAITILLILIETLSGDIKTANIHKAGLLLLTTQPNGNERLDAIFGDVMMCDIKSATSSFSQPRFAMSEALLEDFERLKTLAFMPYRSDLSALGSGFETFNVRRHLTADFIRILQAMRCLIVGVEQDREMGMGTSGIHASDFLVLEHQLLSVRCDATTNASYDPALAACCQTAALLYCNLCLWSWPKTSTLIKNLLSSFRAGLAQWRPNPSADEHQYLLLWLHFIGAFASESVEGSEVDLAGLRDVAAQLGIEGESSYRDGLSRFFYVEYLMGGYLRHCCSETVSNV